MLADISISGAVGATLALSGLAIFDVQIMVDILLFCMTMRS